MEKKLLLVLTVSNNDWGKLERLVKKNNVDNIHINIDELKIDTKAIESQGISNIMVIQNMQGCENEENCTKVVKEYLNIYKDFNTCIALHNKDLNLNKEKINLKELSKCVPIWDGLTTSGGSNYSKLIENIIISVRNVEEGVINDKKTEIKNLFNSVFEDILKNAQERDNMFRQLRAEILTPLVALDIIMQAENEGIKVNNKECLMSRIGNEIKKAENKIDKLNELIEEKSLCEELNQLFGKIGSLESGEFHNQLKNIATKMEEKI